MSLRNKAREILIGVFKALHDEDPAYFKMYEKYGTHTEKGIFNHAIAMTKDEREVVAWTSPVFRKNYAQTFRKVKANLTRTRAAPELIYRLKEKEFTPDTIASMKHSDMSPLLQHHIKCALEAKFKRDFYDPDAKPKMKTKRKGMYQCGKCKSFDIDIRLFQTRGADEPMTVFAKCENCGKRWR